MLDERVDRLGEALKLPPQYETERASIEAALPAIRLPGASSFEPQALGFVHRYQPARDDAGPAGRVTLSRMLQGAALTPPLQESQSRCWS